MGPVAVGKSTLYIEKVTEEDIDTYRLVFMWSEPKHSIAFELPKFELSEWSKQPGKISPIFCCW